MLFSSPTGSFSTLSTLHTSNLDALAWSGAEFEVVFASLSKDQLIKNNSLEYRILNHKLMDIQATLNEFWCAFILSLLHLPTHKISAWTVAHFLSVLRLFLQTPLHQTPSLTPDYDEQSEQSEGTATLEAASSSSSNTNLHRTFTQCTVPFCN
jgi:hypothetical protein